MKIDEQNPHVGENFVLTYKRNVIKDVLREGWITKFYTYGDEAKAMIRKLKENDPPYSNELLRQMAIRHYQEMLVSKDLVAVDPEELPQNTVLFRSERIETKD